MNKFILVALLGATLFAVASAADVSCAEGGASTASLDNCKTGVEFADAGGDKYCDCTVADDGYFVSTKAVKTTGSEADAALLACNAGCNTCTATDNTKCSVCATDYTLVGTTCCPDACGTCTTVTTAAGIPQCKSCATGYGLEKGTTIDSTTGIDPEECIECTGTNCGTCDGLAPTVCTSCEDGGYLSTDAKTCTACSLANCTQCLNATYCMTCNSTPATFNNATGKCFGSALKIGSVVATLVATGVLALVF